VVPSGRGDKGAWYLRAMRVAVLFTSALLAACGASTEAVAPTDAAADNAVVESAVPDSRVADSLVADVPTFADAPAMDDAAVGCNKLVNDALLVTAEYVPSEVPVAMGGTIADGVYQRARLIFYTGAGGMSGPATDTERTVAWFTGGNFQLVGSFNGNPDERSSGTYAASGTTFTFQRLCPMMATSPYDRFTATEREITLYSATLKRALVYTRR
jgi:hypothetical protein